MSYQVIIQMIVQVIIFYYSLLRYKLLHYLPQVLFDHNVIILFQILFKSNHQYLPYFLILNFKHPLFLSYFNLLKPPYTFQTQAWNPHQHLTSIFLNHQHLQKHLNLFHINFYLFNSYFNSDWGFRFIMISYLDYDNLFKFNFIFNSNSNYYQ